MNNSDKNAISRQVELIIRQLGSLSTLPEVAAGFLPHLAKGRVNTAALSSIIEADPALTARTLSLARSSDVAFKDDKPSIAEALAKLPASVIRDAILSIKVFQVFDADQDPDAKQTLPRKQLALYSLAVACCAGQIARFVLPERDRELAFSAGLLVDIGKLAIDEVMPKSFEKIVIEARKTNSALAPIEHKHLGLDHTIVGKRLAEKWSLPDEIVMAIWLQNSDVDAISTDLPGAKIAQVVRLATIIARQSNIGTSGDFDAPPSSAETAKAVGLSDEQLAEIVKNLPDQVAQKSDMLGLNTRGATAAYCDLISDTAADLSHNNTALEQKNKNLTGDSMQMQFIKDFLLSVTPEKTAIDVASDFASGFASHYQTRQLCIFIQTEPDESLLDAICIDRSGHVTTALLTVPAEAKAVPEKLQNKFDILPLAEHASWLNDQVEIDLQNAKIAPLLSGRLAIGAIAFSEGAPVDPDVQISLLSASMSVAASVIRSKLAGQKQTVLAERFAQLLGRLRQTRGELAEAGTLSGIAEMAAGAAHELNNPLAVISGRAQLMLDTEGDDNKKQMLKQIKDRTDEISQIVTDLMSFARPSEPTRHMVSVKDLVDKAIAQTCTKHELGQLEVDLDGIDTLGDVFVDGEQLITAIANILSNALQSYPGDNGPLKIETAAQQSEDSVAFAIIDIGRGMDAKTLAKATEPFYSVREAGRRRGMGLAHSQRLIKLNGGTLTLKSKPDEGTTVTITLPKM